MSTEPTTPEAPITIEALTNILYAAYPPPSGVDHVAYVYELLGDAEQAMPVVAAVWPRAVAEGRRQAESRWGVRTTYTDGSSGTEWWPDRGEAEDFIRYYHEFDRRPEMRVRMRELVTQDVAPLEARVVEFPPAQIAEGRDG